MKEMKICVGTRDPHEEVIDLDEYGWPDKRDLSDEDYERAFGMLSSVLNGGILFANTGHRNDDAVNSCIALHVLGFSPVKWFTNFFNDVGELFYPVSIDLFMEHVRRVCDYVDRWGPEGKEFWALDYALR